MTCDQPDPKDNFSTITKIRYFDPFRCDGPLRDIHAGIRFSSYHLTQTQFHCTLWVLIRVQNKYFFSCFLKNESRPDTISRNPVLNSNKRKVSIKFVSEADHVIKRFIGVNIFFAYLKRMFNLIFLPDTQT